ncbi:hypothetical protein O6H91_21G065000 [Diphasiastrum complanatum]|uniref:Uncharacterized protein n=1 Tax=Diphasiastrum complanatum TaxID=34168 RepID=A0ACC2ALA6_DIPCM|nr:hypothetical protein O6H91_21G065000 [Diphasiastrum complanatum]
MKQSQYATIHFETDVFVALVVAIFIRHHTFVCRCRKLLASLLHLHRDIVQMKCYSYEQMRHSNILVPPARLPPPLPVVVPSSLKTTARPSIEVCRDFVRGRCNRDAEDCRYAHHTPSAGDGDYVIVCQDFVRGKCDRETCRYFHPPKYLRSRIRDLPLGGSSAFDLGRYEPSTLDAYSAFAGANLYEQQSSKRMRVDDSGRHRRRSSPGPLYGGGHVPPLYQAPPPPALKSSNANDQDKLPICRDFLRNKCDRESTCRYVHPDSHIQVVDNYVTLCRDFLRGKCNRELCRFYHPPTKKYSSSRGENGGSERREEEDFVPSNADSMYHASASPEVNGQSP